jgi:acetolactate synthase I/II/III large subunit
VVLILNDSAYGMIKWKQANMDFEDFGLDFNNPDFIKYAESYSAKGHRLSSADELAPLLQSCLDEGGVHLIDAPVDYSENDLILNRQLPELTKNI